MTAEETIRPIHKIDCNKLFETGFKIFDYSPQGKRLDLNFYYERHSGAYEVYVIADGKHVRALLCILIKGNHLYISRLGVHKSFQKQGYMSRLLDFAIRQMENRGLSVATAKVIENTVEAWERWEFEAIKWDTDPWWGRYAVVEYERV